MRLFGLLGPNGPLPIHITEYVRHRLRHAGDPTLSRFLDLLHHRFLALFYRAWAQAQPHVNRDRADRGSLPDLRRRVRRHRAGAAAGSRLGAGSGAGCFTPARWCARCAMPTDWRRSSVSSFACRSRIEEFVGHWLVAGAARPHVPAAGRRRRSARARCWARRVWDHQSKFRIHLGPADAGAIRSVPARDATAGGRRRARRRAPAGSSWTGCGSTSVSSSIGMSACISSGRRCPR